MATRYVLARNAAGRPTLQHRVGDELDWTYCGVYIGNWSRLWSDTVIDLLYCRRCKGMS